MIRLDEESAADEAGRRSAWETAVGAALDRLDRRTIEGVSVPALADPRSLQPERGVPGDFPYVRGAQVGPWDVRSWVRTPDASEAAAHLEHDLAEGATSVWLTVGGDGVPVDRVETALAPVILDAAPVVVEATGGVSPAAAAEAFARRLESSEHRHPRHQLGLDPYADGRLDQESLVTVARRADDLGIRGLVCDATRYADRGAGDTAEVGLAVAGGLEILRAAESAGLDPQSVARTLEFRLSVTDDQMVSVAKLRAARLLWAGALREAGLPPESAAMQQHAVTARPMLTRYDSWTNVLRTTVAAFAAGVGGAESVTVLPFDVALGRSTSLSRRLARNISVLLQEESHLGASTDPAGGAYAVEQLTDTLAAAAWEEVRRVEGVGGLAAALADGSVDSRIAATAEERARQVRTRARPVTGVSEFPLVGESLPEREPWQHPDPVVGWADEFEALRDEPTTRSVLIATMGTVAQHTARAGFATNACAAGGVATVSAGVTSSAEEVGTALREADTTVAILAGTDAQYAESGAAYIRALRDAGATWVVLAGKPSPEVGDLVDDHIAVGTDVVAACRSLRDQLAGGES